MSPCRLNGRLSDHIDMGNAVFQIFLRYPDKAEGFVETAQMGLRRQGDRICRIKPLTGGDRFAHQCIAQPLAAMGRRDDDAADR